jgi:hypothetical protein
MAFDSGSVHAMIIGLLDNLTRPNLVSGQQLRFYSEHPELVKLTFQ